MAILIAVLLDPLRFVVALAVVLCSKRWYIILVAAAVSAISAETLDLTQRVRIRGQSLPVSFLGGLIHASLVFWIRSWFVRKRKRRLAIKEESNIPSGSQEDGDNPIAEVETHLRRMGYDLMPLGAGVAAAGRMSGYNSVETASHIALITLALDAKEAGFDVEKLAAFMPRAEAHLKVLKEYKDKGMMDPAVWKNDANAVFRVAMVDEHQEKWIEKVLSDPMAGKGRLAKSRVLAADEDQSPAMVEALIEELSAMRAERNTSPEDGRTLLDIAVSGTPDEIEDLLAKGADPNARAEENGENPLHAAAAESKNPAIVEVLLVAGADVNARAKNGRTPLHDAAGWSKTPAIVEALLAAGADPKARDKSDRVPFDYAKANKSIQGTKVYWWLNDAQF